MKKVISAVALILMLCTMLTACAGTNKLTGTWSVTEDGVTMSFVFNDDGTGEINALEGLFKVTYTYEVKDNNIIFIENEQEVLGTTPYTFTINGDELSLTAGGDVLVLTKEK